MKNKSLYILRYLVHGVHVMWLLGYHTLSYQALQVPVVHVTKVVKDTVHVSVDGTSLIN